MLIRNSTMKKSQSEAKQSDKRDIKQLKKYYLERYKGLNVDDEKDAKICQQLVDEMKEKLETLNFSYAQNNNKSQKILKIDDFLTPKITTIEQVTSKRKNPNKNNYHLALKNHNSFLLASHSTGFKVTDNGLVVYSAKPQMPSKRILDVCYHKKLNCYLSASRTTIYRKDIDSKDPYPCIQITCLNRCYRFFRYCGFHGRVILINSNKGFSVLNARARRVEFEAPSYLEGGKTRIKDFELFGKRQDRAVALGWKQSLLLLCNFDFRRKKVLQVSSTPIQTERNKVFGMSLAVDPKGKYVCVETGRAAQINQNRSSKIFIFKIQTIKLEFLSLVENWRPRMDYREALICYGYFGWKVIFVGISFCDLGKAHLIVYDEMEKKLEEKREESVEHQTLSPRRILRCGDFLYYVGGTGKVMRLKLSLRG